MVPARFEAVERHVREQAGDPERLRHIQGVVRSARELAERFGLPQERAELAAWLHDLARGWPHRRLLEAVREAGMAVDGLERSHPELLHGPVAAWWAGSRLGVDDGAVLEAVRFHTTGRPEPTALDLVLMVADFCEPGRAFGPAQEVRELARTSLETAYGRVLELRLRWLVERGLPVHPRTVAARNWWLTRGGRAGVAG